MKFNLTSKQYNYLSSALAGSHHELLAKITNYHNIGATISLTLSEDDADEIRDWVGLELQKQGFDESYNLTEQGKILDQLTDIFYIE